MVNGIWIIFATFILNLADPKEFSKANYYKNFQPLWARDNLQKSNKLNWRKCE